MQKKNIVCEAPIETGYYIKVGLTLILMDVCIHCGAIGAPDILFRLKELRKKCLSDGHTCLPVCKDCLGSGKKIIKKGERNTTQKRKEK